MVKLSFKQYNYTIYNLIVQILLIWLVVSTLVVAFLPDGMTIDKDGKKRSHRLREKNIASVHNLKADATEPEKNDSPEVSKFHYIDT